MSDDLVLYTNPRSRGRIVRWMLEEVGAPYWVEAVTYGPAMKGPDYRAINPMGKVPAIVHGGTVVTEVAAICAYLADAFPQAGLAPPLDQRGAYYRWMFFAAGPVEAAITDRILGLDRVPEDQRGTVGYGSYETMLDGLEVAVTAGPYVAGDRFTAADVSVGAMIGWGMQFGTIEARPSFEAYWQRVSDRDAYRRASELDEALGAEMEAAG